MVVMTFHSSCLLFTEPTYKTLVDGSVVKSPPAHGGDMGLIPGLESSPEERNGNPLQYSCLGNLMDREAWQATVHGATKSGTHLGDEHFQHYSCAPQFPFKYVLGPYS